MTDSFDPTSIRRPDPRLRNYYVVLSLIGGLIPALPLFSKYLTLQYHFDESGVSMKWGILFRHEIHLTYRRIQDIHLTRNLLQRWFGLATVSIQTASGSSAPEMKIDGILAAEQLRDYLYLKMRGSRGLDQESTSTRASIETAEVTQVLIDIRDALRRIAQGDSPQPTAIVAQAQALIDSSTADTMTSAATTADDVEVAEAIVEQIAEPVAEPILESSSASDSATDTRGSEASVIARVDDAEANIVPSPLQPTSTVADDEVIPEASCVTGPETQMQRDVS